jgi:hypothetical protein
MLSDKWRIFGVGRACKVFIRGILYMLAWVQILQQLLIIADALLWGLLGPLTFRLDEVWQLSCSCLRVVGILRTAR